MSSDDIRSILRHFYKVLREKVNPLEIVPVIDDLTDFDRQQITATARNDGSILGNDKLLDTLRRRSTRSFVSFLTRLRESNLEIAEEIENYISEYFHHIYKSLVSYKTAQEKPSATVRPSVTYQPVVQSSHISSETNVHARHGQRSDTQIVYRRQEESRETYISSNLRVESVHRTTEVRHKTFREDTLLEEVPNPIFMKWASELNKDSNWNKLGDEINLSRKEIRDLKNKDNPGEEILDILSNKPDFTVKQLMHYLERAELQKVLDAVTQGLEPTIVYERTDQTTSSHTQTNSEDQNPTKNSRDTVNAVGEVVEQMNISNDSITSTNDNEDKSESPTIGAEGISKTLINNLNRTSINIKAAKEVHIHLNSETERTQIVEEQNTETTNYNDPLIVNRETSSEENKTPSPTCSANNQNGLRLINSAENILDYKTFEGSANLLHHSLSDTAALGSSFIDEDHDQGSLDRSSVARQQVHTSPNMQDNFEKNLEQEHNALVRDLQNQPNLDSFRDIQNSIPGTSSSGNIRGPEEQNQDRLVARQRMIQNQDESSSGTNNAEKNIEQDHAAFVRDIENQPRLESYRNIQSSMPENQSDHV